MNTLTYILKEINKANIIAGIKVTNAEWYADDMIINNRLLDELSELCQEDEKVTLESLVDKAKQTYTKLVAKSVLNVDTNFQKFGGCEKPDWAEIRRVIRLDKTDVKLDDVNIILGLLSYLCGEGLGSMEELEKLGILESAPDPSSTSSTSLASLAEYLSKDIEAEKAIINLLFEYLPASIKKTSKLESIIDYLELIK